ncbi:MAG: N-6 DNA methylase [Pseudanabaena sp. ELA645]|jgi:type I restriction-modification system DNA methylase subunit
MNATVSQSWIEQLNLADKQVPEFFRSFEELEAAQIGISQIHVMRRAWQDLELDGILYQDKSPYIYIKEVSSIDPQETRRLHRRLWNQGIAPFLLIVSPNEFHIYSSLVLPAKENEDINKDHRLVEVLSRAADALELRQFARSLEFGELFHKKPKSFNPELRVDRYLLKNLKAAREKLLEPVKGVALDLKIIHALLWRVIFVSYLTDRKIIDTRYFHNIGATDVTSLRQLLEKFSPKKSRELLYALFEQLKQDFNGDLFEGDLIEEREYIQNSHIEILGKLLRGDDLSNGQLSLGFWAYDFSVIPIETISGIYEQFLEVESPKQKRESGTYYTPRFLAEVVLDVALEKFTSLLNKKFLDPACGSGIFLVSLFNRLAEEWLRNNRNASNKYRADSLSNILQNQLFGVDADPTETACRIAAFSLYLAFLDQLEPRAIQELQEQGNVLPNLVGHNILCQDFFDDALVLPNDFDLVVGNPPWARGSTLVERWCKQESLPMAQKQLAYGFMWKAPRHIKDNGLVCFLLPSSILLNHQTKALEAQYHWLSNHTVEQVLNLSDMSFYLFDGAIRPALVVSYTKELPNQSKGFIDYLVPKTEREILSAEIISIAPEDRVQIKLERLLHDLSSGEAALDWKQYLWGTPRDKKFLDRLSYLPPLGDVVDSIKIKPNKREKRWVMGRGFQPSNNESQRDYISLWSSEKLFIGGKNRNKSIDLLLLESDCTKVGNRFQKLFRLPDQQIFQAPHVLVPQGVTKGLKAGYSDFDVCFQDSIHGIHGVEKDSNLLMFLSVVLNSNFGNYFLFHTAANWGTERDKVHEEELLRIPFPFPEDTQSPVESETIIREVSSKLKQLKKQLENTLLGRNEIIEQAKQDLLVYVYRYYQIDELEQILINDTVNCWIPSSTPNRGSPNIPTLKDSTAKERLEYLSLLCDLLNTWSRRGSYQVSGKIIFASNSKMAVIVLQKVLSQDVSPLNEHTSSPELDAVISRILNLLPRHEGSIAYYRNLKVFDRDKLYILKPLAYRFWSKTTALNDADEIAAAILTNDYRG